LTVDDDCYYLDDGDEMMMMMMIMMMIQGQTVSTVCTVFQFVLRQFREKTDNRHPNQSTTIIRIFEYVRFD